MKNTPVCFALQHNYAGPNDWQEATTCMSSNKWMWDSLMSRLRNGEVDPRQTAFRLQPVVANKYDWVPVEWDDLEISPSGGFFLA